MSFLVSFKIYRMQGIILAAGYGTRFFPVTKSFPKEMLPLLTKPAISFVVEEFIDSGIDDIIFILSPRKNLIKNYLLPDVHLEKDLYALSGKKRNDLPRYDAHFSFLVQEKMLGTGHALLQALPFLDEGPFIVAYPDDIVIAKEPLARQLMKVYEKTKACVLATLENPPHLERYGVVKLAENQLHIRDIVEKPSKGNFPSNQASLGRFLYTKKFFDYLKEGWDRHEKGEYFHVYALKKMMEQNQVVACPIQGTRLDLGDPQGFFRSTIRYASQFQEYKKILHEELETLQAEGSM